MIINRCAIGSLLYDYQVLFLAGAVQSSIIRSIPKISIVHGNFYSKRGIVPSGKNGKIVPHAVKMDISLQ